MAPTMNDHETSDDVANDVYTNTGKRQEKELKMQNVFRSLPKETTEHIMTFLMIEDIIGFRTTTKYLHNSLKMAYTKEHCKVISENLKVIYVRGGFHAMRRVLLNNSCVDPAANDNYVFRWASEKGHLDVVRLLLGDPRVNPSARDNEAICMASEEGHWNVVRLLLNDSRFVA